MENSNKKTSAVRRYCTPELKFILLSRGPVLCASTIGGFGPGTMLEFEVNMDTDEL